MRAATLSALALTLGAAPALAQPEPAPAPAPAAPPAPPAPAARPGVAVFDAHAAVGVDPRAAAFVTDNLRRSAAALGYAALPPDQTRAVLARHSGFGALTPARALEVTRSSSARWGVFANVSAEGGRHVLSLTVIPADGSPPRHARGDAAHGELGPTTERLLRSVLPPAAPAPPPAPPALAPLPPPALTPPAAQPAPPPYEQRFRLALQTEAAFGVATGSFYNHLAGARLDRRFSEEFALGAYAGYANLKGKEGRAHNVLAHFMLEYRIGLDDDWALPLRFAPGYLPQNGPTLRMSAGVSWEVADDVELVLEPVTPMVWLTGDEAVLSLNVAAEVAWTL